MLTKRCLILQERQAGDAGRFLDILTKTEGVLEVFVRGSKKANSKHLAATQPFAYSKLCLAEKNGRYYVESAEPIHLFYGLREHLTQLALAAYFFDLIRYAVPTGQQQNFILRLTLNTLYYLTTGNRSEAFLKNVFELRFIS
ncbi:MAG: DNA repair protein RecO, partial [Ruminococcus sp.]|nr:DNA repair protein RecO [Ruminococcus sp.]